MSSKEFKTAILITGDASGAQKAIKLTAEQLEGLNKKASESSGIAAKLAADWSKSFTLTGDSLGKQAASAAKWGAALSGAAVVGAAAFVKSAIDSADAAGKMAAQLGISVEAYTKLDYAAKLADVSQSAFESSLKRMTKTVADAAAGSSSAAKALEALGLSAESLLDLSADQQLGAIADRLNLVENASQRAALEMKIFGRAGLEMHNIIKEGSAGIARMSDEAVRFGVVISGDLAAKADAFNDNLDRLKAAAVGVGLSVADELLGPLGEFSTRLTELAAQKETAEGIATFIKGIGTAVVFTAETIATTANVFKFLGEELAALFGGPAIGDIERLNERIGELQNKIKYFGSGDLTQRDAAKVKALKDEIAALQRMVRVSEDLAASAARAAAAAENAKRESVKAAAADNQHTNQMIRKDAVTRALTSSTAELAAASANAREEDMARIIAQEQATRATEAARAATESQATAMQEAAEQADPWAEALQDAAARVDSAFVDMWKNIDDGFDGFADGLKDGFKQLLAELAHQAVTRPILMRFASAMGLGAASGSAYAGGGTSGGAGGVNLGSIMQIGGMAKKFYGGFTGGGGLSGGLDAMFGGAGGSTFASLGNGIGGLYSGMGSIASGLGLDSVALASNARGLSWTHGGMTGGQMLGNIGMNVGAGIVGGMAGNYLGENVLTDGRQAQNSYGATAGGMIGSIWGPIGTAIGSAIGSLVDVAFGTDDTKRVRLGITAGNYSGIPSNLTDTQVGASGLKFMSEHNRTDDNGEGAKALMDAFLGVDASLTSIASSLGINVDLSSARLVNPRYVGSSAVQDGFFGTALNNTMDANGLKNATKEFITAWLEQIKDDLPERVRVVMAGATQKTAEEMVQVFGLIAGIDRLLDIDALKQTAEQTQTAGRTILDVYSEVTSTVVDLAQQYDGSVDSLTALAEALTAQKDAAIQLALAYEQASQVIDSTFGDTITRIQESMMSDEQLYASRREQIDTLVAQLDNTIDPAQIANLVTRIDSLAGSAWGILDDSQQQAMGTEFLAFLEQAMALAAGQVGEGQASLASRETATANAVDLELVAAAEMQNQAATTFAAAVTQFAGLVDALSFDRFAYGEVNR